MADPLHTFEEAAVLLRMSESKLRRLMKAKLIQYRRIGRNVYLTQSDLDRFLEESRQPAEESSSPAPEKVFGDRE